MQFGYNIDFYVKTIDTYIEFDGIYYHGIDRPINVVIEKSPKIYRKYLRDRELDVLMLNNRMNLIRIREDDFKLNEKIVLELLTSRILKCKQKS